MYKRQMLTTKVNSAWAVKTSAGIILIDTLFGYAAQDAIVDGLKKVGLDPADIKYIIVSHAHGDHDGAVKFLQDTYKPRIIMGPKDWELSAREADPPRHDMEATDGQKVTLGDTLDCTPKMRHEVKGPPNIEWRGVWMWPGECTAVI